MNNNRPFLKKKANSPNRVAALPPVFPPAMPPLGLRISAPVRNVNINDVSTPEWEEHLGNVWTVPNNRFNIGKIPVGNANKSASTKWANLNYVNTTNLRLSGTKRRNHNNANKNNNNMNNNEGNLSNSNLNNLPFATPPKILRMSPKNTTMKNNKNKKNSP